MNIKKDYFMMALMLFMTVGLVVSISVSIGYTTKAATREYEYETLRRDYQERIDNLEKELKKEQEKLSQRMESEAYFNKRRYEILDSEIKSLSDGRKNKNTDLENNKH